MYTLRNYVPTDANKTDMSSLSSTYFSGFRTIKDKDGNEYDLIDVIGCKSKADSAEDFTDWTTDENTNGSVTYAQIYGSETSNPRTMVIYIREAYRNIFKFSQDVLPLYLFSSVTAGSKTAITDMSVSPYYWYNVDDEETTGYLKGVLQDNGYEYYFHFDFYNDLISSSSTLYLYISYARDSVYSPYNAGSNNDYWGITQYGYSPNDSGTGIENYIEAIEESGGVDTFTVTVSGSNFTADNASEYESGENVTVIITPNSGYDISSVGCNDETAVITENGDGTFTVTFAISQNTVITVVTSASGTTTEYITIVNKDESNCTFTYYDVDGNELDESALPTHEYIKIVCTANDNYYFAVAPRIVLYSGMATQTSYNFSIDESNPDSDYPTIYSYEIAANTSSTYTIQFSIYGYGTLQDSDFEGYGTCNFYLVSKSDLKTIADSRNKTKTLDYSYVFTDMGDYISTLVCIYMDVNGSGSSEALLLGGYSTGLTVEKISNLFQTVDCGYFTIDEIFNNAYDYENVSIRAYLPFYGFADLETAKYMNKTTHVYYKVFVQTGDSLIIFENESGDILDTIQCNIAYDIPYLVKGEAFDDNSTQINTNLLYGFTPFIEISYNNKANSIDTKCYNDEVVTIGDLNGFIKCEEVFNTIQTTQQERTLIDNLLKNGILI